MKQQQCCRLLRFALFSPFLLFLGVVFTWGNKTQFLFILMRPAFSSYYTLLIIMIQGVWIVFTRQLNASIQSMWVHSRVVSRCGLCPLSTSFYVSLHSTWTVGKSMLLCTLWIVCWRASCSKRCLSSRVLWLQPPASSPRWPRRVPTTSRRPSHWLWPGSVECVSNRNVFSQFCFCRLQLMCWLRLHSDCDLSDHGPARLHVLLCGGALVVCQAAPSAAVLPSTW